MPPWSWVLAFLASPVPFAGSEALSAAAPDEDLSSEPSRPCLALLKSGGCVFVFSVIDVEDGTQMALFEHFVLHYAAMGIPVAQILALVHVRPPGGHAEAVAGARLLRDAFGIRKVRLLVETDTSGRDSPYEYLLAIWGLLAAWVKPEDWLIHCDPDELVVFPPKDGSRALGWTDTERRADAHAFFDEVDNVGANIVYGYVADRLSADGTLAEVEPSSRGRTLFEQFPRNCGATLLLRGADPRRTTAYRGYIRADLGHHVALGLGPDRNMTATAAEEESEDEEKKALRLLGMGRVLHSRLRGAMGPELYGLWPTRGKGLPVLVPWLNFASVFHFKWNLGLVSRFKLLGQQGWLLLNPFLQDEALDGLGVRDGKLPVEKICLRPDVSAERRHGALTAGELLTLVQSEASAAICPQSFCHFYAERQRLLRMMLQIWDYDLHALLALMRPWTTRWTRSPA